MVKYIKVDWPDSQCFEDKKDCYPANILGADNEPLCVFVPEDTYEEWEINKLYPANIFIPELGLATVMRDSILIGNDAWSRKEEDLKKGSKVILYSLEKGYWITTCIAYSDGFPPIFEDSSTLVECEIVGIKNE